MIIEVHHIWPFYDMKELMKERIWSRVTSFAVIIIGLDKWRLAHLISVVKSLAPNFCCLLVCWYFLPAAHSGVLR